MISTSHTNRVVVLVDMDCFYCQVEEKLNPALENKPIAVVQYNQWRGGGIIAVNYPARDRGVTRHMRGNEAKEKCPEIELVRVPNVRGKADLTKYREAGKRVAEVLQTFTSLLERASVDEAYLDITESVEKRLKHMVDKLSIDSLGNTHVVGIETPDFLYNSYNNEFSNESNLKLLIGGAIVEEIRAAVYERTGYRCSAGIAHNKILAKLACGINKPNKQTILPQDGVQELFEKLPIKKIKSLGGKFGVTLSEDLNITYMGELLQFSERELCKKFDDKTASWLYNICRGIDTEPVTVRLVSKSIGCCKKFPGRTALKTIDQVTHWITELATEISERLEQDIVENNRKAKQMVLSFAQPSTNKKDVNTTKSLSLNSYESDKIAADALDTLKKLTQKSDGTFCLTFLGISVGKFENIKSQNDISIFFKNVENNLNKSSNDDSVNNKTIEMKTKECKTKPTQDISVFFKNNIETNKNENKTSKDISKNEQLNIDEIEDDADNDEINLNDTLKDIENIRSVFDDDEEDSYSNTTIEVDYTTQLENKEEFPHFKENPLSPQKNEIIHESNSFFVKYLNSSENTIFTPPSAIDQQLAGCSYRYVSPVPKTEIICQDSNSSSIFDDESICPECNKKINPVDFISHMDHHLAEKLMQEEREMFQSEFQAKKTQLQTTTKSKSTNNKGIKRKTVDNNLSITSFFTQKDEDNDKENAEMQICPECDKRIKVEEFPCHLDYHAAKKLHLELNKSETMISPKTKNVIKNNNTKTNSNNNKNSCKKTNGISISSYFKSVEN